MVVLRDARRTYSRLTIHFQATSRQGRARSAGRSLKEGFKEGVRREGGAKSRPGFGGRGARRIRSLLWEGYVQTTSRDPTGVSIQISLRHLKWSQRKDILAGGLGFEGHAVGLVI